MKIVLESTLRSRVTRFKNTLDTSGKFRIGKRVKSGIEKIVSGAMWLAQKFAGLVGFVFGKLLKLMPFSISSIFGFLVNGYYTLKTFNWNETDEAVNKKIAANNQRVVDALAPLAGSALGWGVVRLANIAIGKAGGILQKGKQPTPGINIPVLSGRIALKLAEESRDEVGGQFKAFLNTIQRTQTENAMLGFLLTARNTGLFGWKPISAPLPNASFQAKIEEEIEKLPANWQNFAEEFLESFEEAIIEACYIVAFEADDYMLMMKQGLKPQQQTKTFEVTIDVPTTTN